MTSFYATTSTSVDWSQGPFTLVLPSLGIGNVGQLAIDLTISTLQLPLVGHIDSPFVVPVVGNDAFTEKEGRLATAIDVYLFAEKKTLIVQQRSPVLEGKHNAFVDGLISWVKSTSINQVILLTSTDAAFRFAERQLTGSQIRYFGFPGRENQNNKYIEIAKNQKWLEAEPESVAEILKRGTVSQKLYTACRQADIAVFVLTIFCSEGNNIPEGTQMATLLSFLVEHQISEWKMPSSWKAMLTPSPFETNLFM